MAKLNYHHLQYFHAIATHGSIAQASKVMHITPQTLSAQLSLLEEQLGYSLFERKNKRLVLNEMGHKTLGYAQEIFRLGDELMDALKSHSTDFAFRFSIGVTDVIAKVFSFNFLKAIYSMDDSVKLICKENSLDLLLGELAVNKLDAVLSDKPLPTGSRLKAYSHLVGQSGLSFFTHPELAQKLQQNFPYSLHQTPFFTAGKGSNQRLSVLSWFNELNITAKVIGEIDDSILTKYFGQAGYGVFCAPTIIENHVLEQFNVDLVGRTQDVIEHYYLISPERQVKHPAVQHLLEESKKLFNQNADASTRTFTDTKP